MAQRLAILLLLSFFLALPTTAASQGTLPHPAYAKFESFVLKWASTVNANYRCSRTKAEVVRRDGQFVARFFALDPGTIKTKVKPSGSKASPFVGIMRYVEGIYESVGTTPEAALNGPYSLVKKTRITDIFRFSKGCWVY